MTDEEYELFYEVFQGAVPPKVVPPSYLRINSILTDIKVILDQNEVMRTRLHSIDNGESMVEILDHWWRFNNEEFMDYLWIIYDNAMNEKKCKSMPPKPPHNPKVPDAIKDRVNSCEPIEEYKIHKCEVCNGQLYYLHIPFLKNTRECIREVFCECGFFGCCYEPQKLIIPEEFKEKVKKFMEDNK